MLNLAAKVPTWVYLLGAAGVALYVIKKGGLQGAVAGVTAGAAGVAGDFAKGAAKGAVLGVGDVIGLPRTDLSDCKKAILMADNGDASFYCSAGVFARWQYLSLRKRLTGATFTMSDIFE